MLYCLRHPALSNYTILIQKGTSNPNPRAVSVTITPPVHIASKTIGGKYTPKIPGRKSTFKKLTSPSTGAVQFRADTIRWAEGSGAAHFRGETSSTGNASQKSSQDKAVFNLRSHGGSCQVDVPSMFHLCRELTRRELPSLPSDSLACFSVMLHKTHTQKISGPSIAISARSMSAQLETTSWVALSSHRKGLFYFFNDFNWLCNTRARRGKTTALSPGPVVIPDLGAPAVVHVSINLVSSKHICYISVY